MIERSPCVYILASARNGTLYIGVTSKLAQRLWQHRQGVMEGFSQKYGTYRLVWFESCDEMSAAIVREKQIKKWNRMWKLRLIENLNPDWNDLSFELNLLDHTQPETKTGFPPPRE